MARTQAPDQHPVVSGVELLEENLHRITFSGGKVLYLLGTAHVSSASVALVEKTLEQVRPDSLCVELDAKRLEALQGDGGYKDLDLVRMIRSGQLAFFAGQFVLASYQRRLGEKYGIRPGEELGAAVRWAGSHEVEIHTIDRDLGITLRRTWRLLGFRGRLKLLFRLLLGGGDLEEMDVEQLKKEDILQSLLQDLGKDLPVLKQVLVDERDRFLASSILHHLGSVTVAVVGAGHVPGMLAALAQPPSEEAITTSRQIPPPNPWARVVPWLLPALVLGLVVWGFLGGRREVTGQAAIYWILVNGVLTAVGCLVAFAHPLTTLSGFLAAPLTSLNPTVGAGFVTALVQALLVPPRVRDLEKIQSRSLRLREWWSNRITRVLLVFILSSVGSAIGTFVALPLLVNAFAGG